MDALNMQLHIYVQHFSELLKCFNTKKNFNSENNTAILSNGYP